MILVVGERINMMGLGSMLHPDSMRRGHGNSAFGVFPGLALCVSGLGCPTRGCVESDCGWLVLRLSWNIPGCDQIVGDRAKVKMETSGDAGPFAVLTS